MALLIEVHGAGGSGKSTLVRRVVEKMPVVGPLPVPDPFVYETLRKGTQLYNLRPRRGGKPREFGEIRLVGSLDAAWRCTLAVVGKYDNACGGCDALPSIDFCYGLAKLMLDSGCHVIMEGKLLSAGAPERAMKIRGQGHDVLVIQLTTTLEESLAGINERRAAAGKEPLSGDVSMENLKSTLSGSESLARRLAQRGVTVLWKDREAAYRAVMERLELVT